MAGCRNPDLRSILEHGWYRRAVISDPELLAAWRDGDARAGQELFGRYFEPVSRFFANKVHDERDDLVQETFEACLRGRDRLRADTSFRSYLFSVAFNVLKGYYRRRRSHDHVMAAADELFASSLHDLAPGPSTIVGAVQQEQLLLEALRRIPMELQAVLEMRYWEERTPSDPNPATRRAFGSKHTGSQGVRRWLPVLPSAPACAPGLLALGAVGAAPGGATSLRSQGAPRAVRGRSGPTLARPLQAAHGRPWAPSAALPGPPCAPSVPAALAGCKPASGQLA